VANGRNGLDVDKFDYLQRDSMYCNVRISADFDRIQKYSKVPHRSAGALSACGAGAMQWPFTEYSHPVLLLCR